MQSAACVGHLELHAAPWGQQQRAGCSDLQQHIMHVYTKAFSSVQHWQRTCQRRKIIALHDTLQRATMSKFGTLQSLGQWHKIIPVSPRLHNALHHVT